MNQTIPKVAIIIINYNGYKDTIECLKSLASIDYPEFKVFLVDNMSTNKSQFEINKYLKNLSTKNSPFKYSFIEYQKLKKNLSNKQTKFFLIQSGENLGFGGGNNIGIQVANSVDTFNYFWFLNNDTEVFQNSLSQLVKQMELHKNVGFASSILLYHNNTNLIQSAGVKFFPPLGIGFHIFNKKNKKNLNKITKDFKICQLVPATALLVRKETMDQLNGFDDKNFFMYGEDTDLVLRGKKLGWLAGIVKNSLVLHKKNASTSSNRAIYYEMMFKSQLIVIKKHFNKIYLITSLIPIIGITFLLTLSIKKIYFAFLGWLDGVQHKII